MYITAARHDEVVPFEGVKMYVEKLQSCIKQHKCYINNNQNTTHPWRKVGGN